jgi:hypothetical protein
MDALEVSDRELDGTLSASQKLAMALEMMSAGIRLKRANYRRTNPRADDAEIEALLTRWLTADD